MTDTNTPDRIWTTGNNSSGAWNSATASTKRIKLDESQYLLSTPTREQADSLLTTLTKVRDACLVDDPHGLTVETEVTISYELFAEMQDAIAKAKGSDNDR